MNLECVKDKVINFYVLQEIGCILLENTTLGFQQRFDCGPLEPELVRVFISLKYFHLYGTKLQHCVYRPGRDLQSI